MSAQNQATDRAYRIGQTNNVQVYKLIMKNSIEEKIQKLQEQNKIYRICLSKTIMVLLPKCLLQILLIYLNKEKGDQRRSIFKSPFLM